MASRTSSALATLALAALSTAAVLTLGRVFASGRFVLPAVGAVLLAHLLGFVARARGWSLVDALSLSMSGLAVYLIWFLAPHTTLYGIPTADTFRVLADRLGDGVHELRTAVVPARATDGAIVLSVLVVWVMAATADALAFWRRATIGAVAPALALFVWASTLGTDSLATRTTAGFLVAGLLFLLVQHQSLVGRGRTSFSGQRVRAGATVITLGALVGAIAVVGALVVGPALPGADADPLIDVRGLGPHDRSYRVEPPLARIGEDFVGRGRVEVFTVRSPRQDYWRVAALDRYESTNGGEWTLAAQGNDEVQDGLHAPVDSTVLRQEFHITGLADRWLPAAYEPVQLEGGDDPLVVKASSTLVSRCAATRGCLPTSLPTCAPLPVRSPPAPRRPTTALALWSSSSSTRPRDSTTRSTSTSGPTRRARTPSASSCRAAPASACSSRAASRPWPGPPACRRASRSATHPAGTTASPASSASRRRTRTPGVRSGSRASVGRASSPPPTATCPAAAGSRAAGA